MKESCSSSLSSPLSPDNAIIRLMKLSEQSVTLHTNHFLLPYSALFSRCLIFELFVDLDQNTKTIYALELIREWHEPSLQQ